MSNRNAGDARASLPPGRTAVVVGVNLLIGLDHIFPLGTLLRGRLHVLYYSYSLDIAVPFGMYLLLGLNNMRLGFLRDWRVKAVLVLGVGSITEVLQAFKVPILGRTFDPLDFVMFAVGVSLAALAERFVLDRFFPIRVTGR